MDLKAEIARKRRQSKGESGSVEPAVTERRSSAPMIEYHAQDQQDPDAVVLMINQIELKTQGRTTFNELDELAADIKAVGQLQPIIVKQIDTHRYRLIAGERRYRAISKHLKQETIRATIRRVDESETDIRFVQISENTQRDDYLPLELAAELVAIKHETGLTNKQIALRIGKTKSYVSKYISLLAAPGEIKQAISKGEISATAWFNNKAHVVQKLSSGQSNSAAPIVKNRQTILPVSMDIALDVARILQTLSKQKGLANIDVDLTASVTKKQLQAILIARTNDVLQSL